MNPSPWPVHLEGYPPPYGAKASSGQHGVNPYAAYGSGLPHAPSAGLAYGYSSAAVQNGMFWPPGIPGSMHEHAQWQAYAARASAWPQAVAPWPQGYLHAARNHAQVGYQYPEAGSNNEHAAAIQGYGQVPRPPAPPQTAPTVADEYKGISAAGPQGSVPGLGSAVQLVKAPASTPTVEKHSSPLQVAVSAGAPDWAEDTFDDAPALAANSPPPPLPDEPPPPAAGAATGDVAAAAAVQLPSPAQVQRPSVNAAFVGPSAYAAIPPPRPPVAGPVPPPRPPPPRPPPRHTLHIAPAAHAVRAASKHNAEQRPAKRPRWGPLTPSGRVTAYRSTAMPSASSTPHTPLPQNINHSTAAATTSSAQDFADAMRAIQMLAAAAKAAAQLTARVGPGGQQPYHKADAAAAVQHSQPSHWMGASSYKQLHGSITGTSAAVKHENGGPPAGASAEVLALYHEAQQLKEQLQLGSQQLATQLAELKQLKVSHGAALQRLAAVQQCAALNDEVWVYNAAGRQRGPCSLMQLMQQHASGHLKHEQRIDHCNDTLTTTFALELGRYPDLQQAPEDAQAASIRAQAVLQQYSHKLQEQDRLCAKLALLRARQQQQVLADAKWKCGISGSGSVRTDEVLEALQGGRLLASDGVVLQCGALTTGLGLHDIRTAGGLLARVTALSDSVAEESSLQSHDTSMQRIDLKAALNCAAPCWLLHCIEDQSGIQVPVTWAELITAVENGVLQRDALVRHVYCADYNACTIASLQQALLQGAHGEGTGKSSDGVELMVGNVRASAAAVAALGQSLRGPITNAVCAVLERVFDEWYTGNLELERKPPPEPSPMHQATQATNHLKISVPCSSQALQQPSHAQQQNAAGVPHNDPLTKARDLSPDSTMDTIQQNRGVGCKAALPATVGAASQQDVSLRDVPSDVVDGVQSDTVVTVASRQSNMAGPRKSRFGAAVLRRRAAQELELAQGPAGAVQQEEAAPRDQGAALQTLTAASDPHGLGAAPNLQGNAGDLQATTAAAANVDGTDSGCQDLAVVTQETAILGESGDWNIRLATDKAVGPTAALPGTSLAEAGCVNIAAPQHGQSANAEHVQRAMAMSTVPLQQSCAAAGPVTQVPASRPPGPGSGPGTLPVSQPGGGLHPFCLCGRKAHVCRSIQATDKDRLLLLCHGHDTQGSCGYRAWLDEVSKRAAMIFSAVLDELPREPAQHISMPPTAAEGAHAVADPRPNRCAEVSDSLRAGTFVEDRRTDKSQSTAQAIQPMEVGPDQTGVKATVGMTEDSQDEQQPAHEGRPDATSPVTADGTSEHPGIVNGALVDNSSKDTNQDIRAVANADGQAEDVEDMDHEVPAVTVSACETEQDVNTAAKQPGRENGDLPGIAASGRAAVRAKCNVRRRGKGRAGRRAGQSNRARATRTRKRQREIAERQTQGASGASAGRGGVAEGIQDDSATTHGHTTQEEENVINVSCAQGNDASDDVHDHMAEAVCQDDALAKSHDEGHIQGTESQSGDGWATDTATVPGLSGLPSYAPSSDGLRASGLHNSEGETDGQPDTNLQQVKFGRTARRKASASVMLMTPPQETKDSDAVRCSVTVTEQQTAKQPATIATATATATAAAAFTGTSSAGMSDDTEGTESGQTDGESQGPDEVMDGCQKLSLYEELQMAAAQGGVSSAADVVKGRRRTQVHRLDWTMQQEQQATNEKRGARARAKRATSEGPSAMSEGAAGSDKDCAGEANAPSTQARAASRPPVNVHRIRKTASKRASTPETTISQAISADAVDEYQEELLMRRAHCARELPPVRKGAQAHLGSLQGPPATGRRGALRGAPLEQCAARVVQEAASLSLAAAAGTAAIDRKYRNEKRKLQKEHFGGEAGEIDLKRQAETWKDELTKWKQLKVDAKPVKFGRSPVHAWGLFAIEPIEADEFIVEYVGERVRKEVAEQREKLYEANGLGSSYLFRVDLEWVVDATVQGGLARYINHSCDPNCYTRIEEVAGEKHITINAKRRIEPGEELCYDYKFEFEDQDAKIPCSCGAKNCRKYMN